MHIVPAILPKSRKELAEKLARLSQIPGVTRVQIDVVDGTFATPPSWPYNAVGELADMVAHEEHLPRLGHIEYEIDLMNADAQEAAGQWIALGATRLTFHAEGIISLPEFFRRLHTRYGAGLPGLVSFGIALNLSTDPALIESCLSQVQYVQCMGIKTIGRQGQPFDARVVERVRALRKKYPDLSVQVDGGVSLTTAPALIEAGVTDLVVGSVIVSAKDPAEVFKAFTALSISMG